jgi:hypothetical protein
MRRPIGARGEAGRTARLVLVGGTGALLALVPDGDPAGADSGPGLPHVGIPVPGVATVEVSVAPSRPAGIRVSGGSISVDAGSASISVPVPVVPVPVLPGGGLPDPARADCCPTRSYRALGSPVRHCPGRRNRSPGYRHCPGRCNRHPGCRLCLR